MIAIVQFIEIIAQYKQFSLSVTLSKELTVDKFLPQEFYLLRKTLLTG